MKRVAFEIFRSASESWQILFERAAEFAGGIGRERIISISHSEDSNEGVVVVWYWTTAAM